MKLKKGQNKTVVVLGMHRSGTSLVAKLLAKMGVDMGKDKWGKTYSNPTGHFEDEEFYDLNREILKAKGKTWINPPAIDETISTTTQIDGKVLKTIRARDKRKIWGWKDPQTCLNAHIFHRYLNNPYYIVCRRSDAEVAKSLNRRDDLNIEDVKKLSIHYNACINQFINTYNLNVLEIEHSQIIKNPEKWITKLADFIDIKLTPQMLTELHEVIVPKDKLHVLQNKMKAEDEHRD